MSDLNDILKQQLEAQKEKVENEKANKEIELMPVETAFTDLASDKIRDITNHIIKKSSQKGLDFLERTSGINFRQQAQNLTEKAKNLANELDEKNANELLNMAKNHISNTINKGGEAIHNLKSMMNPLEQIRSVAPPPKFDLEAGRELEGLVEEL